MSEARAGLIPSDQPLGKTHRVTITAGNPPKVHPDPVEISKSKREQVKWECPDCKSSFTVDFPSGSPVARQKYDQDDPVSGPAKPDAELKTYKYSVTVDGITLDPGFKVKG